MTPRGVRAAIATLGLPSFNVDLSNADLVIADLINVDLIMVDLSGRADASRGSGHAV